MTVVAGIDVGNATTEVVVGRVTDGGVEVVAADRAPTRRTKGSPESLAGAVALVRRLERRHGVRVERAVAAPLRPVLTEGASLPEERPATGRLRAVGTGAATAGGGGSGAGRPVPVGARLGPEPVVVVVPSGLRYDDVARALSGPVASGLVAAVLLEDDEGVLVANRLPTGIPVVDEVAPDAVLAAERVAVEVPLDGRPLQVLTDPLKLATALGLPASEVADAATLAGQLFDAPNAVVALDSSSVRPTLPSPTGWIEVAGTRLPFLAGQEQVRSGRVGDAGGYAVPPGLEPREVDDLWAVDLGAVASSVLARRSAARDRPVALAAMHTTAGWSDPAAQLAELLGVPVTTAPSEAVAARAGALTTPAAPGDAVVVDLGGGTIDVVAPEGVVVAAGAGDLLTVSVASLTGGSAAAAEWVKRGPAHRVEAPQILLGEDGGRGFLDSPAPPETTGALVVRGPAGLLAFSRTMAPGEWRALRLRLKTDLVGGNIARALRSLGVRPRTVIAVGGSAGDDEVLVAVTGALPPGTAVARGHVGGTLGHRYAVAYGLLLVD